MKKIVISLLMMGAAVAFANEAADDRQNRVSFESQRTRAEVKAEYLRAQKDGTLLVTSEAASLQAQAPVQGGLRSREAVKQEAVQAARVRIVHELI